MNLVFGRGQETTDFWNMVIIPQTIGYFSQDDDQLESIIV
jgi:hypothetical protein